MSNAAHCLSQGFSAHKNGDFKKALTHYNAVLKHEPNNADANYNIGRIISDYGDKEQAVSFFENAVNANPKIYQFWYGYFEILLKCNKFLDLKKALKKAKKRGVPNAQLKEYSKKALSISHFDKATWKEESGIEKLEFYIKAGQIKETEKLAENLCRNFPSNVFFWKTLAKSQLFLGKFSCAIKAFDKVTHLNSNDYESFANLGISYLKTKNLI